MPYGSPRTREFLKDRVDIDAETGCWIWRLGVDHNGYGLLGPGAQERLAHRLSYRLFKGEIPSDLDVDHMCFTRRCVNPLHLRLLTHADNLRYRREGTRAQNHCRRGHEFTTENTMSNGPKRRCRACYRARTSRKA